MASDQSLSLIGHTIDNRYKVQGKLDQGGMAEVYLADDLRTGRRLVLKSPFPGMLLDDPALGERFIREIRVMSRLDHPNIIKVYDVVEHAGRPVAVMQYMSGGNLEGRGEIGLDKWLLQIAGALDYLHTNKLVHRDVKPGNILFDSQGAPYLSDLGIVKALKGATMIFSGLGGSTQSGFAMGSPKYMSPEAVEGGELDGRSDQYALAIIVYERLAGRIPFDAATPMHIFAAHLTSPPRRLSELDSRYGEATTEVLNRALAKRREKRFGSCREFAQAVFASLATSSAKMQPNGHGLQSSSSGVSISDAASSVSNAPVTVLPAVHEDGSVVWPTSPQPPASSLVWTPWGMPSPSRSEPSLPAVPSTDRPDPAARPLRPSSAPVTPSMVPPGNKPDADQPLSVRNERIVPDRKSPAADSRVASRSEFASSPTPRNLAVPSASPQPPPLALAPFTAFDARDYQQAWATYLGQPAEFTNSIGMQFKLLPPGEFMMGAALIESARMSARPLLSFLRASPDNEANRSGPEALHRVRITRPFYLGVYEVTQAEYERVMGSNPSDFSQNGNRSDRVSGEATTSFPVESVSWEEATAFCAKLGTWAAEQSSGRLYRLPTEAEWEYACRAGTTTPFHFGTQLNGREANCNGNDAYGTSHEGPYLGRPTAVGSYGSNPFGLYDMHGNVWEWCSDWYAEGYYSESPVADPTGPVGGWFQWLRGHAVRGGSWMNSGFECRSANRESRTSAIQSNNVGFRVVYVPRKASPR